MTTLQLTNSRLTLNGLSWGECTPEQQLEFRKLLHFEQTGCVVLSDEEFKKLLRKIHWRYYFEPSKSYTDVEVVYGDCWKNEISIMADFSVSHYGHLELEGYRIDDGEFEYCLTDKQEVFLEKVLNAYNDENAPSDIDDSQNGFQYGE